MWPIFDARLTASKYGRRAAPAQTAMAIRLRAVSALDLTFCHRTEGAGCSTDDRWPAPATAAALLVTNRTTEGVTHAP
jgi:hypothetical protein